MLPFPSSGKEVNKTTKCPTSTLASVCCGNLVGTQRPPEVKGAHVRQLEDHLHESLIQASLLSHQEVLAGFDQMLHAPAARCSHNPGSGPDEAFMNLW